MSLDNQIIAIDTLGGDSYTIGLDGKPIQIPVVERVMKGAIKKAKSLKETQGDALNLELVFIGKKDQIQKELDQAEISLPTHIEPAKTYFDSEDKTSSSLYLLLEGIGKDFDGGITIGDTAKIMKHIGGKLHDLGIKGVGEFPLANYIPIRDEKQVFYVDMGANTVCRPEHLYQFAHMARIVLQEMQGIDNPKIGIVTVGEEEYKGNRLVKRTMDLCKRAKEYAPNIVRAEPRDVELGKVDAALLDGHTGNIVLKSVEAKAETILRSTQQAITNIVKEMIFDYQSRTELEQLECGIFLDSAELAEKVQKIPELLMGRLMKQYVFQSLGAASLYGLRSRADEKSAILKKGHGVSNADVISSAISSCRAEILAKITHKMEDYFTNEYFLPLRD